MFMEERKAYKKHIFPTLYMEKILLDAIYEKGEAWGGRQLELQEHTPNHKDRVQRKERLRIWTTVNLGPRGTKGKVLKIKGD